MDIIPQHLLEKQILRCTQNDMSLPDDIGLPAYSMVSSLMLYSASFDLSSHRLPTVI